MLNSHYSLQQTSIKGVDNTDMTCKNILLGITKHFFFFKEKFTKGVLNLNGKTL